MKPITTLSLGFTFAGCFLGAGYVSGQEIWQFFGGFGSPGVLGLLLAVILQFLFGSLLLCLGRETGLKELDKIVIRWERPGLRALVGGTEIFFMFGVCVIMYAGAGALMAQLLDLPAAIGSALLCAMVAVVSLKGFSALVKAFSMAVPFLVVLTMVFSGMSVAEFSFEGIPAPEKAANPLLGNWLFSAITFVSYNLFSSIGIFAPIAGHVKDKKTVFKGVALGCFFLFAIAFAIIIAMSAYPASISEQLPMLELAGVLSPVAGGIYAVLLLMGMFGTSLSCHVAAVEYLGQKSPKLRENRSALTIALVILGWAGSLVGFSDLVGTVYPICGYCGFGALICVCEHYIHVRKKAQK